MVLSYPLTERSVLPEQLAILQSMPIFGGLQSHALEQLLAGSVQRSYAPGDLLVVEDEAPGAVFVLTHGRVEVIKHVLEREFFLCELGPGDCIGEMSWIDPCVRSASVRALSPCEAICLEPRNFYHLRHSDLSQFSVLQLNISRELARRLRAVEARLFAILAEQPTRDA